MPDATAQERGCLRQAADFLSQYVHQRGLRVWATVCQGAFEVIPDTLVGIQRRSVGRKRHQMKTASSIQEFLHRVPAMDGTVVQQHDQVAGNLRQEMAQEESDLLALDVVLVELAVQRAVETPRTDGDPRDGRDPVVTVTVPQDWRLAYRTPGFEDGRDQKEPGLVDEYDVGRQPCGVFFTAGQTACFHAAMAASLRSTARRSGFW